MDYKPIFVYGTLKCGERNFNYFLKNKVDNIILAEVRGSLYNLGAFPGYVDDSQDIVYGELMFINKEKYIDVLNGIDCLEGFYGSKNSLNMYNRKSVSVKTKDSECSAWIYVWGGNTNNVSKITNGSW